MTHKSTWKNRERTIAKDYGTRRTPLSGGNGGVTRSDTWHPDLFLEIKLRAKHSAVQLWDKTKQLADQENKLPGVMLCEKGRPGYWLVIKDTDLETFYKKKIEYNNNQNNK